MYIPAFQLLLKIMSGWCFCLVTISSQVVTGPLVGGCIFLLVHHVPHGSLFSYVYLYLLFTSPPCPPPPDFRFENSTLNIWNKTYYASTERPFCCIPNSLRKLQNFSLSATSTIFFFSCPHLGIWLQNFSILPCP